MGATRLSTCRVREPSIVVSLNRDTLDTLGEDDTIRLPSEQDEEAKSFELALELSKLSCERNSQPQNDYDDDMEKAICLSKQSLSQSYLDLELALKLSEQTFLSETYVV